jgi:hypothetical protein
LVEGKGEPEPSICGRFSGLEAPGIFVPGGRSMDGTGLQPFVSARTSTHRR